MNNYDVIIIGAGAAGMMCAIAAGFLFYGIRQYQDTNRKHKPEAIDPVDRTQYSKEWLEQVITSNIEPPISNLIIHSVQINSGINNVVYVVEIPQSLTGHQVTTNKDYRYYIRLNFQVIPMEDYLIRDVMNRAKKPDVMVEFYDILIDTNVDRHNYILGIRIQNKSHLLVDHFKLEFSFPDLKFQNQNSAVDWELRSNKIIYTRNPKLINVIFNSIDVLYPNEDIEIGKKDIYDLNSIYLKYTFDNYIYYDFHSGKYSSIKWTLYADDMIPKYGSNPVPNRF